MASLEVAIRKSSYELAFIRAEIIRVFFDSKLSRVFGQVSYDKCSIRVQRIVDVRQGHARRQVSLSRHPLLPPFDELSCCQLFCL